MKGFLTLIVLFVTSGLMAQQEELLIARNTGVKLLPDGNEIRTMGFAQSLSANPNVPGPILYFTEGDSATIHLWNVSQGAPHTVHLHGLDVNQENDGVPHLSFDVGHMEHGYYHFKVPAPGTYLYHCHVVSTIHVQAGMYGLLIVRPKDLPHYTWEGGYRYEREHNYLMSEVDTFWHQDSVLLHDHGPQHKVYVPEYHPQFFLVNGWALQQLDSELEPVYMSVDSSALVRLANLGYMGNKLHFPPEVKATVISSDGRPLPVGIDTQELTVFPGERYQILLSSGTTIQDSIRVEYLDMNTLQVKGGAHIPVISKTALGLADVAGLKLKIYPNPFSNEIQLAWEKATPLTKVEIIDPMGRVVISKQIPEIRQGHFTLATQTLKGGIYLVKVYGKKEFEVHRVIRTN